MENQEKPKKKIGRPKGSFSKEKVDLQNILRLNAGYILNRAIELATSKPEKYQPLMMKLLDKITPNLNVNTNINISNDFEGKLIDVLSRANQLKAPETVQIQDVQTLTLPNKEDANTEKTDIYEVSVQDKTQELDKQLNKVFSSDKGGRIADEGGVCPDANG